jgi:hypothetical protein
MNKIRTRQFWSDMLLLAMIICAFSMVVMLLSSIATNEVETPDTLRYIGEQEL